MVNTENMLQCFMPRRHKNKLCSPSSIFLRLVYDGVAKEVAIRTPHTTVILCNLQKSSPCSFYHHLLLGVDFTQCMSKLRVQNATFLGSKRAFRDNKENNVYFGI